MEQQQQRIKSRLTVVESLCFSVGTESAVAYGGPFSREVDSDEQPYVRPAAKVGERWVKLDLGWLGGDGANCSMLLIANRMTQFQTIPGYEDKKNAEAKILEIAVWVQAPGDSMDGILVPIILILPGESARFSPYPGAKYSVRCVSGETKYDIHALPM